MAIGGAPGKGYRTWGWLKGKAWERGWEAPGADPPKAHPRWREKPAWLPRLPILEPPVQRFAYRLERWRPILPVRPKHSHPTRKQAGVDRGCKQGWKRKVLPLGHKRRAHVVRDGSRVKPPGAEVRHEFGFPR